LKFYVKVKKLKSDYILIRTYFINFYRKTQIISFDLWHFVNFLNYNYLSNSILILFCKINYYLLMHHLVSNILVTAMSNSNQFKNTAEIFKIMDANYVLNIMFLIIKILINSSNFNTCVIINFQKNILRKLSLPTINLFKNKYCDIFKIINFTKSVVIERLN